jgi:hypothetical protein
MRYLKNRKFAILITVVVAITAVLFGVNRSLTRLTRNIERMFYDGVYIEESKYTQPSIDSQIIKHADAALGLATILKNYPELADDAETVLKLRRELYDAKSISDKSSVFWRMSGAVYSLAQAALETDMPERDSEAVARYSATISGAETFIRNAAYNQKVSELWQETSFFAQAVRRLLPVREPEMF